MMLLAYAPLSILWILLLLLWEFEIPLLLLRFYIEMDKVDSIFVLDSFFIFFDRFYCVTVWNLNY